MADGPLECCQPRMSLAARLVEVCCARQRSSSTSTWKGRQCKKTTTGPNGHTCGRLPIMNSPLREREFTSSIQPALAYEDMSMLESSAKARMAAKQ